MTQAHEKPVDDPTDASSGASSGAPVEAHSGKHAVAVAREHGVEVMFTLSGAHVFPMYDGAVTADPPMRIIDVRHEQTAAFAAEAMGKLTRTPGLAVLTAGPGVTNGVSAVAQAQFNVRNMRRAGLRPPLVWVDVEPVSVQPWSGNVAFNNAVVDGVVAGYRGAGLTVGLYSYAYGWKHITGGRRLPTVATWVPSGDDQRSSALARCGSASFSGGVVLLGQWTADGRDHDVSCRAAGGRFPRLFAST